MSIQQMPPEFAEYTEGRRVERDSKDRTLRIYSKTPEFRLSSTRGEQYPDWCFLDGVGFWHKCRHFKLIPLPNPSNTITLTLTREQAERLIEDFSTSKITRSMDDLKQMIKEKLQ